MFFTVYPYLVLGRPWCRQTLFPGCCCLHCCCCCCLHCCCPHCCPRCCCWNLFRYLEVFLKNTAKSQQSTLQELKVSQKIRNFLQCLELQKSFSFLADHLKVPKCEIFDRSDFPDFYTIKSSWVGDLVVKILTYFFNF
jgi:hypothetical protein